MKKLRSVLVLFLLFGVMFMANEKVDATPGQLKKDSIIICKGVRYGEHAGHWHIAIKGKKGGYYPDGSPVSKPCGKAKKKKSTVRAHSNGTKKSGSNSSRNYSVNASNPSSSSTVSKHISDNDVAKVDSSDTDKEKDDVDTLKDQEETTPEVSNFTDNDVSAQNTDEKSNNKIASGNDLFASVMVGFVLGSGSTYIVSKKRNKKKKDDLTNW